MAVWRSNGNDGIFVYPAAGGEPVILPLDRVWSASWLPDQSGMLVTDNSHFKSHYGWGQVWQQPFPKGEPQRITNDLNSYGSVHLTGDGKRFATVQSQKLSTIFVGAASDPDKRTPINASHSDGYGLAWMPDGRLLSNDLSSQFWLASADGKDRIAAFRIGKPSSSFSICGGGSLLVLLHYQRAETPYGE